MTESEDWIHDPDRAVRVTRTGPRQKTTAPDWFRCEWIRGDKRCRLGDGHAGPHEVERTNEVPRDE